MIIGLSSCFGEIMKTKTVIWDKVREGGGIGNLATTRRVWMRMKAGIKLPIKNILAGNIVTIQHKGQQYCKICLLPKNCWSLGNKDCKNPQTWKAALENSWKM